MYSLFVVCNAMRAAEKPGLLRSEPGECLQVDKEGRRAV